MEFPIVESVWLLRGIAALLIFFLLLYGWSANIFGIQDLLTEALEGGTMFSPMEEVQAIQSVEVLVCAINSVAIGEPYLADGCSKYFKDSGTVSSAPYTGYALGDMSMGKTLCHRIKYYYYCSSICYSNDEKVEEFGTLMECEKAKINYQSGALIEEREGAILSCSEKPSGYVCTVNNFSLPQEVSGFEEWIPYHGDPYYLAYWQNLPQEEDTWNFRSSWTTYAIMAGIALIPWGKVIGGVGKKLLKPALNLLSKSKVMQWSAKKFINGLVRVKFWETFSRRGLGKTGAVKRFMRRALNKVSQRSAGGLKAGKYVVKNSDEYVKIKNFIDDITRVQVERAFDLTSKEMADVAMELANPEKYLEQYSRKLVENVFREASEHGFPALAGLDRVVKEKMIKDINSKLLQLATREVLKESWAARILSKNSLKELPSYALKSGVKFAELYGVARAMEIADSIIKAREEEIPNAIVLKKPLFDPYEFPLSNEMNGRPVFVNLANIKDYWILPQLWDDQKHFYLASPCHLESMEVKGVFTSCGNFEYEKIFEFDETTGLKVGESGKKSCEGEIEIKDKQKEPECDIEKYKIDTSGFSSTDSDFINWMQDLTEMPDMGLIYDEAERLNVKWTTHDGRTGTGTIESEFTALADTSYYTLLRIERSGETITAEEIRASTEASILQVGDVIVRKDPSGNENRWEVLSFSKEEYFTIPTAEDEYVYYYPKEGRITNSFDSINVKWTTHDGRTGTGTIESEFTALADTSYYTLLRIERGGETITAEEIRASTEASILQAGDVIVRKDPSGNENRWEVLSFFRETLEGWKQKDLAKDAVELPENRQEALKMISEALLDCFERMEQKYKGTCVVFDTLRLEGGPITEKDMQKWMCGDDDECKKGNLKPEKRETAIDLIGYGLTNLDNMDWDIESISAGAPHFVSIYPGYTLTNEIRVNEIDNKYAMLLEERDIEVNKHGLGITDIRITLEGEPTKGFATAPIGGGGIYEIKNEIIIELSDMGDDGTLRSISISNGQDMSKTITDLDFAEDGFEKFSLKNCYTPAVLVHEMEKDQDYDLNYCTRGETTGGAWLEFAGDAAGVVAIGVACTVGALASGGMTCIAAVGASAGWIMAGWAAVEVATEAATQVGGWPTQTW